MTTPDTPHPSSVPPSELVAAVRAARRIAVLTGAGMSAESGIPTFRDALTGLWSKFDPQELATREGFKRDPALVWGWYEARRRQAARISPNAGHVAIRDLAALSWVEEVSVITQNVDDLHERAGSSEVIHLHGSLFAPRCFACGRAPSQEDIPESSLDPIADDDRSVPPPHCQHCQGLIRPGVVWFGEALPTIEWSRAVKRVQEADLLLVVGTSGQVYPAASLPEYVKKSCPVWVINPDGSAGFPSRRRWGSTAAVGLPALARA